jgi:glycosyltransferase involved in cell wall biosynthesis
MRVAAICCIRNEQDIIEAFIRHTAVYCDDIVVLDHGSTDRSAEILRSLQKEGLPLHLLHDATLGHLEVEFTNRLVRIAAHDLCADWILPLDADELIDGAADRSFLPESGEICLKLKMRNYHCHPDDDARLLNPVERMAHRLEREPWPEGDPFQYKTMVPGAFARLSGARFTQGKHRFLTDGRDAESIVTGDVWLAHFSLRSASQYACKLMAKRLQEFRFVAASSEERKFYNGHYEVLRRSYSEFAAEFEKMRMSWLPQNGLDKMVRDPMRYRGGSLRFTPGTEGEDEVVRSLFAFAEQFAKPVGEANATVEERRPIAVTATAMPVPGSRTELSVASENSVLQTVWLPVENSAQTERIRFTLDCTPGVLDIRRVIFRSANAARTDAVVEGSPLYEKLSVIAGAARVVSKSEGMRLLVSHGLAAFDLAVDGVAGLGEFSEVGVEFFHEDRNVAHVVFAPHLLNQINAEQKELAIAKHELALVRCKLDRLGFDDLDFAMGRFHGVCRPGTAIDFTQGGNAGIFQRGGWHLAEDWGTWTDGARASLKIRIEPRPEFSLRMRTLALAFVHPGAKEMGVTVSANSRRIGEWAVGEKPKFYDVQIPAEEFAAGVCDIAFDIAKPVVPNELGIGPDMRKLGMGVIRIEFEKQRAGSRLSGIFGWRR